MNIKSPPILVITFNRPHFTKQLLEKISTLNPKTIYIFADHPRLNNKKDEELCKNNREIIKQFVETNNAKYYFSEANMGCKKGVTSAISWAFETEEQIIILEDDCDPSPSFFNFCTYALKKYKNNHQIFSICGTYYGKKTRPPGYYFSHFNSVWGWATWKRSWESIDFTMAKYDTKEFSDKAKKYYINRSIRNWVLSYISDEFTKKSNIWSPYLYYTKILQNSYTINPYSNLVQNIGFLEGANSHENTNTYLTNFKTADMNLSDTQTVATIDREADDEIFAEIKKFDSRLFLKVRVHQAISKFLYRTNLIKILWKIKKLKTLIG